MLHYFQNPLLHHDLSGSFSLQSWVPAVLVCTSLLATARGAESLGWVQASGTEEMLNAHVRTLPEDKENFIERGLEKMRGHFKGPGAGYWGFMGKGVPALVQEKL